MTAKRCCPCRPRPYDACDKRTTRVTSLSLVRYRANDYSAPTRYGHRQVLLKGYVDEIVICFVAAKRSRATGAVTNAKS